MLARRFYLVLWISLAIAATLVALVAIHGTGGEALTLLLRVSARMSFIIFIVWLTLPSFSRINTGREMDAEPYLLISFTVAHTIHLGVIAFALFQGYFAQITEGELLRFVFGGGTAYLMMVLMGLTALRKPSRARAALRVAGSIYVGLVFLNSYINRFLEGELMNALGIVALAVAAALCLAAWRARRSALKARTVSA